MKTQLVVTPLAIFFATIILISACKKDNNDNDTPTNITIPGGATLTTAEATVITSTSAMLGGKIINIGDCALMEHGLAINTSPNPTIDHVTHLDNTVADTGSFTILVGSLLPSTTYYVRAFATNCKGTNYGNEIHFTTLGGGNGGNDTGFFKLTIFGVTYFAYDIFHPLAATVFPEGDTRFGWLSVDDSLNHLFSIAGNSSFMMDASQSFGFSFGYYNENVNGTGTYTFGKSTLSPKKSTEISIRTGPGVAAFQTNPNTNWYTTISNYERHLVNSNCIETELTYGINTLIITKWGNPGEFIEGTITGTTYEDAKALYNCQNSVGTTFYVEFKLKRYQ